MSFEVGDYVEHFNLPHIWKIAEINDGQVITGRFAKLELIWTPSDFELPPHLCPNWSMTRVIYEDITKRIFGMSLKDLRTPSNEMLVIALESSR